ncbi:hypothetical protein A3F36_00685 [Candidatus Peribacteria bacterium RIFCSPHIGHO2_12_FULL_55_11]|nr:MAG: hypothetical protein A3F36_00685 [Candidatus Peribacteria bacterium RIFCSPHIGHO2_12_FULL_55_11]
MPNQTSEIEDVDYRVTTVRRERFPSWIVFLFMIILLLMSLVTWWGTDALVKTRANNEETKKMIKENAAKQASAAAEAPPQPGRKKIIAIDAQDVHGNPYSFDAVLTDSSVEEESARRLNAAQRILDLEQRAEEAQQRQAQLQKQLNKLRKSLDNTADESDDALQKVKSAFEAALANETAERKKLDTLSQTRYQNHEARLEALERAPKYVPQSSSAHSPSLPVRATVLRTPTRSTNCR